jgi:limonene-1,2-epoxide hydrolase
MGPNSSLVADFINAWMEKDLEKIMSFLSEDCVYHNIPMEPAVGQDAIRVMINGFLGMASEIDWITHHIGESEQGSVFTERTDRFLIGEKWLEIRVMGIFEVSDGAITAWRDYFDMGQFQSQMAAN